MAEENFAKSETISDEAAMDLIFEEPGANQEDEDQAAPDAVEAEQDAAPDAPSEAEADQPAKPQTFTVKIDGKEESVPLDELLSGYQRHSDYTRKTQEVAQLRKVVEAGTSELKAALQHWMIPREAEPDWAALAAQMDPREFNQKRVDFEQSQRRSAQARALYDAIAQREHQYVIQSETERLLERIPEWRDPETAKSEFSAIAKAAAEFGFTDEDVAATTDHRIILMARELARLKGADMALKTQKQTTPPVKAAAQGRVSGDDAAARRQKALENLRRTGSDEAALAAILGG